MVALWDNPTCCAPSIVPLGPITGTSPEYDMAWVVTSCEESGPQAHEARSDVHRIRSIRCFIKIKRSQSRKYSKSARVHILVRKGAYVQHGKGAQEAAAAADKAMLCNASIIG